MIRQKVSFGQGVLHKVSAHATNSVLPRGIAIALESSSSVCLLLESIIHLARSVQLLFQDLHLPRMHLTFGLCTLTVGSCH